MNHPFEYKLAKVLNRMGNLYSVRDILERIDNHRMQSFAEGDSWAVTQVAAYPRGTVLEIVVMVGEWKDLPALYDQIEEYADEIGATAMMAYGRKGWLPYAVERGWKLKARNYVYAREL